MESGESLSTLVLTSSSGAPCLRKSLPEHCLDKAHRHIWVACPRSTMNSEGCYIHGDVSVDGGWEPCWPLWEVLDIPNHCPAGLQSTVTPASPILKAGQHANSYQKQIHHFSRLTLLCTWRNCLSCPPLRPLGTAGYSFLASSPSQPFSLLWSWAEMGR